MAASRCVVVEDFRIPDALWERVEPLLSRVRRSRKGGRPPLPRRRVLDGIFYVLRTGCQCADAPDITAQLVMAASKGFSGEILFVCR